MTVLIVHVLSNYATFKLFGVEPIPPYLMFPGVYVAMSIIAKASLPMSGAVSNHSREFIHKMKTQTKHTDSQSFFNSCKPLEVWVHNFYYINNTTVVTFFRIAVDNTVALLLSF